MGKHYLQIIYPTKDLYPEYKEFSKFSTKRIEQLLGKQHEQILHQQIHLDDKHMKRSQLH